MSIKSENEEFYLNMQMEEFVKKGFITVANPKVEEKYKKELINRNLKFCAIKGFRTFSCTTVICKPELKEDYIRFLKYEIDKLEEKLAIKKSSIAEQEK